VVLLDDALQPATFAVDGATRPFERIFKVDVPADGGTAMTLEIAWAGHQCKAPAEGGCPRWRIDASTADFSIGPGDFAAAPQRVPLQGMLLPGASLFEEIKPEGATTSTFEGVAIQVEGTSSYLSLLPGTHSLIVRMDGYRDFALPPVTIPEDAAAVQPLPIPLFVTLEVRSTPVEARVLLAQGTAEPEEIGTTGESPVRTLLDRAQSYRIRVTHGGYKPFEQALTFAEGSDQLALAPTLEAEPSGPRPPHPPPPPPPGGGKLSIVTQPWTMVYIDGRRIKQTPLLNYDVTAGRHRLTLLNQEAGIRHEETVIVQAGRTTMIRRTQDQLH
jgi:hypothetical protein